MNDHKLFTQRIGLIGITNILVSLSGIILLPILTKNIPVEDYGIWVQINVTIGLVPAIALLGFPYTMVRFLAATKEREEIQEGFYSIASVVIVASALASVLLFLLSDPLSAALFNSKSAIVKILSIIVFQECLNNLFYNYFRTFQRIKLYSLFLFMRTWLMVGLVSAFIYSDFGLEGAVLGLLLSSLVVCLSMASLIIFEIGLKIPRFKRLREYITFGLPTVPGNLSSWIVNSSDRYVIGILLSTAFVGYYSPAYTIGTSINMFMAPLSFMLPAVLSRYYDENNMKEVKTVLRYSLKYFLALAIPAVFGLSLMSKQLLAILSTSEIAVQGYLVTPIIAISVLLFGAYTIIYQIIVLEKKTKITGIIWITAAILNLGLNILIIPIIGILGAAITTFIAFASALIATLYSASKYFYFEIDLVFIIKCICASIAMSGLINFFNPTTIITGMVAILAGASVYFTIIFLLKGFDKDEIKFFREIFKI